MPQHDTQSMTRRETELIVQTTVAETQERQ